MIKNTFLSQNHPKRLFFAGSLDSFWFQKAFVFSFCLCAFLFILGNIFEDQLFPLEKGLKKRIPSKDISKEMGGFAFPPFPVNLKASEGISPVLLKIKLKTDKLEAEKEIVLKSKKFKKHLLLLLSGKNKGDLEKNKAWFEEKIKSQFNVFLSKGSVEQVAFHTALIN